MREIIYGTRNAAKIAYMKREVKELPLQIYGLEAAAKAKGIPLPKVEETGSTSLENARLKAETYFCLFKSPVFSCDSGLYLWNDLTDELLPEEEQPGICVRGKGQRRFSDDELLKHYTGLVKKYGQIRGRYKSAVCLIWNENIREESMVWGEPFLFTDIPHTKRVEGFPLDSIALDLKTKKYFYDIEENFQDKLVSDGNFGHFFCNFLEKLELK